MTNLDTKALEAAALEFARRRIGIKPENAEVARHAITDSDRKTTALVIEAYLSAASPPSILEEALEDSQSLLVAMLHEARPRDEIEAQIVANRDAIRSLREGVNG